MDDVKTYPALEELTFTANIQNVEQGLELLKCIQAIVNTLGVSNIITVVRSIEKDPKFLLSLQNK